MNEHYSKVKQQKLADAFEAGDIEVTVCDACFTYFKHPTTPRSKCHRCFSALPESEKSQHKSLDRKFRYWKCTKENRYRLAVKREEMMKGIREAVKTVPKILRPIREIDPSKYKRECLKCSREFLAVSKFQRLCEHDRISASDIGLSEYTHYYVTD